MKNSVAASFRLYVALVAGVLCLVAAVAHRFDMPEWNMPFARFAIAVFGLAWFAQAYAIRNDVRARG